MPSCGDMDGVLAGAGDVCSHGPTGIANSVISPARATESWHRIIIIQVKPRENGVHKSDQAFYYIARF